MSRPRASTLYLSPVTPPLRRVRHRAAPWSTKPWKTKRWNSLPYRRTSKPSVRSAADSDLDLVEETLDADNGYSERWLPKIADVDEEEVLAAEMRGETYQVPADEEKR